MKLIRISRWAALTVAGLIALGALALIALAILGRSMEGRIHSRLTADFPKGGFRISRLHVDLWRNSITGDSVRIITRDSSLLFSADRITVRHICWKLLERKVFDSAVLAGAGADLLRPRLRFPKTYYRIECRRLRASAPDSVAEVQDLLVSPYIGDELFFSIGTYRKTGYRLTVARLGLTGFDFVGAFSGKRIVARSVDLDRTFFDAIASMYKPKNPAALQPSMPVQQLTSVPMLVRIGEVNAAGTRIQYREIYRPDLPPAMIFFDHTRITMRKILSKPRPGEVATLSMSGKFMQSGSMKATLYLPLDTKALTLRYSGSVDNLESRDLNAMLVIGEHIRIDRGFLQSSFFDITVKSGQARGQAYMTYQDLSVSILDSASGARRGIVSWLTNLKIRNNNLPPPQGKGKVGEVKWDKIPCETFLTFVWRALRSGIGDVVGFKVKQKC